LVERFAVSLISFIQGLKLIDCIMKTIAYKIKGMSCDHCVAAVNKAVLSCPGVLDAQVSLEKAEANLEIDETKFNVEEARNAVANAGQYELIV
jgi:copper chaperone